MCIIYISFEFFFCLESIKMSPSRRLTNHKMEVLPVKVGNKSFCFYSTAICAPARDHLLSFLDERDQRGSFIFFSVFIHY